jgi:Zn-finger in ubiquitin-hydrolases and other protein
MAVCTHLEQIKLTDPAGPVEGCQECLKSGSG